MVPVRSASSSWRWASTPSFWSPGSTPSDRLVSEWISSMVISSSSPFFERTIQRSSCSVMVHGGFIQFSGL